MQQRDLLPRAGIQESQVIVERRKMFHSSRVGLESKLCWGPMVTYSELFCPPEAFEPVLIEMAARSNNINS